MIPAAAIWSPGCGMSKRRTRRSRRTLPIYLAPEDQLVLFRSRSTRFAALALAVTTPLIASYAAPAFADGSDADVTATVTDGNVHIESSKDLSRVTIVFCACDPLVIPSWPVGQMEADIEVEGVVQAVFIHSGNNTTPEAQE